MNIRNCIFSGLRVSKMEQLKALKTQTMMQQSQNVKNCRKIFTMPIFSHDQNYTSLCDSRFMPKMNLSPFPSDLYQFQECCA